eukprot:scaffold3118_cov264-Pinguiococcus_pyrenoidosus.AAC.2
MARSMLTSWRTKLGSTTEITRIRSGISSTAAKSSAIKKLRNQARATSSEIVTPYPIRYAQQPRTYATNAPIAARRTFLSVASSSPRRCVYRLKTRFLRKGNESRMAIFITRILRIRMISTKSFAPTSPAYT